MSSGVIRKYTLELSRLRKYCEHKSTFTVSGITRDLLTLFGATWETTSPSSSSRAKVRERLRSFLRYCYETKWSERVPALPKIKVDQRPTMPLTADEYARLLEAIDVATPRRWDGKLPTITAQMRARIRALFQLMRWTGLEHF